MVVIYRTEPVSTLREIPVSNARMELIGDAFVQGLMDLTETPEEVGRPTEWLILC